MGNGRDNEAGRAAERGEGQVLRHQLTQQPRTACPEREPQSDLGPARGNARQQQICQVDTGDEQQDGKRDEERRQRGREIRSRRRGAVRGGAKLQAFSLNLGAPFRRQARAMECGEIGLQDRVGLRFCVRERDARLQATEDVQPHRLVGGRVAKPVAVREDNRLQRERQPEVRLLRRGFTDEPWPRHAYHRQGRLTHVERRAEHIGTAAEPPLPVAMADDRRGRTDAIAGREQSADRRRRAEHVEEVLGDQPAPSFLPRAVLEPYLPRAQTALRRHQRGKAVGVSPEVLELLVGQPRSRALAAVPAAGPAAGFVRVRQHHELFRCPHAGQRRVENAVPETENRGVRTDTERQGRDRYCRESRPCQHRAQRIAEVLRQDVPVLARRNRAGVADGAQHEPRLDASTVGAAGVAQLLVEHQAHLRAVFVPEGGGIAAQQGVEDRLDADHPPGTSPVARACWTSAFRRATSAAATRRPNLARR